MYEPIEPSTNFRRALCCCWACSAQSSTAEPRPCAPRPNVRAPSLAKSSVCFTCSSATRICVLFCPLLVSAMSGPPVVESLVQPTIYPKHISVNLCHPRARQGHSQTRGDQPDFVELRTSEVRRIAAHEPTAQGRLEVSRSRTSVTTTRSRSPHPHPGQRQTAVA